MKTVFISLLFIFSSLFSFSQNEFVGVWKLTDTDGDTFMLRINKDHTAESTYNKGENKYFVEIGFWRISGNDLHVLFNNGWLDVISKSKKGYTKTAYKPGQELKKGTSSTAIKLNSTSIWNKASIKDFIGYWELKDENNKTFYLQLKKDKSAQTTYSGSENGVFGEHGTWRFETNRVLITYDSGWVDIITKHGNSYYKVAYAPNQRLFTKPNNNSIATKITKENIVK